MTGDSPSLEALVNWLLEHNDELQLQDMTDSDSESSLDAFSDTDSMSDEFEEMDGAFSDVREDSQVISLYVYIVQLGSRELRTGMCIVKYWILKTCR